MADVIKRGTLLPLEQERVYDFDPQRGWLYRQNFKGASQSYMAALQMDYVRAGIACRLIEHQGDTASLETEDATQQFTLDVWQILGNEISRDGLSHPNLAQQFIDLGADPEQFIAIMRANLEENTDPTVLFGDGGELQDWGGVVERFYRLQMRGSTEYERAQYVLRHTTNAPSQWTENVADFGIDQIYTTSQLLSEVQDSSLWVLPMPDRLAYKISNIPVPTAQAGYQWGWLKKASTETTAPNYRIDIATEYVLEQWSTDEYSPY